MKLLRLPVLLIFLLIIGCASSRPIMPTMDLPPEPVKPKITWEMINHHNQPYLALKMGDGLQLLEYLIRIDALGQMYKSRIDAMNKLVGSK